MQQTRTEQTLTEPTEMPAATEATEGDPISDGASEVRDVSDEVRCDAPSEVADEESDGELTALRARVRDLEGELAARKQMSERIGRECEEFISYFPDVSLQSVPDEVWGQVRGGVPLSAAYAFYEKKQQKQRKDAERIRQRGASMTAGIVDAAGNEYFSPSQVRAMSREEVRQNYDRIFDSMRHWQ